MCSPALDLYHVSRDDWVPSHEVWSMDSLRPMLFNFSNYVATTPEQFVSARDASHVRVCPQATTCRPLCSNTR